MKIVHCLEMFDSSDFRSRLMLAEAFRFIGQSYREIRQFDQSFDYFQRSYDLIRQLNDSHCLFRATFDLGQSLIYKKKFREAIELFHRMIDETTNDHERTFLYQNISRCYLKLNEFDKAKIFGEQALDFALMSNDEILSIESEILLSEIFIELKDISRAENYLRHVQQIKDQHGDLNQMKQIDEFLLRKRQSSFEFSKKFNWRILCPYPFLFEICKREKTSKTFRRHLKATTITTPNE